MSVYIHKHVEIPSRHLGIHTLWGPFTNMV